MNDIRVYKHPNQSGFVILHGNGIPDACPKDDPRYTEVESYLISHPEALIPEPVPPPPTEAELAAREVAAAHAYLASTDWIIAKIGETQMQGKSMATLLTKYAGELAKRSEARVTINEKE